MLLNVARNTVMPMQPMRSTFNAVSTPGENEPGHLSPEDMAAEANFANPLGAAQATMAKINAAQAKKEPEPPSPPPSAAVPAAQGDVGIKAQMIMANQPGAPANPPPGLALGAARGAQFDLQA
jgi:hypothetical protein